MTTSLRRVLMVDDDEIFLAAQVRLHKQQGRAWDLLTTTRSANAMALVREFQPQILVSDIIMPDIEGLQVIQEAKSYAPKMPVIAISGGGRLSGSQVLDLAEAFGADEVLEKPFQSDVLFDLVESYLGKLQA